MSSHDHSEDSGLPTVEDYLSHLSETRCFPTNCLFYAGAGTDIDPALRLMLHTEVTHVVYVDYYRNFFEREERQRDLVRQLNMNLDRYGRPEDDRSMRKRWSILGYDRPQDVYVEDFGYRSINDFTPNWSWAKENDGLPEDTKMGTHTVFYLEERSMDRCMQMACRETSRRYVHFYYLFTEAIQTYLHFWGRFKEAPLCVVLQNHGKGGMWTTLGGDGLFYAASPKLPKLLYVGDNDTKAWPQYHQVSKVFTDEHSMHKSNRALYRCDDGDGINHNSPIHGWDQQSSHIESERYPGFSAFKMLPVGGKLGSS